MKRRFCLQSLAALLFMPWQALASIWDKGNIRPQPMTGDHGSIEIIAPSQVEHGKVVQVQVMSRIPETEAIAIFTPKNPVPMVANFTFNRSAQPYLITRIKLAESQDIEVVVKVGEQYFQATRYIAVLQGDA